MHETRNVRPNQAKEYYQRDNYARTESWQEVTEWIGIGATELNLSGPVAPESLEKTLSGYTPSGIELRCHAAQVINKERGALDSVYSAPKEASLLVLILGKIDVLEAHNRAVKTCLSVTEQRFSQTRMYIDGKRGPIPTQNLLIATFLHDTSRELDPHLHTHCLLMNATKSPLNQQWYSLDNRKIHDHKKWLGKLYQHELARGMQEIGYSIKPRGNGQFQVLGFDQRQLDYFSKRKSQIDSSLLNRGSWQQREQIKSRTRAPKGQPLPKRELIDFWEREAQSISLEYPEPTQLFIPSIPTLNFYKIKQDTTLEDLESELFLTSSIPFSAIEKAVIHNLSEVHSPQLIGHPLQRARKLLDCNQIEQAIALMETSKAIVQQNEPQKELIEVWTRLGHEQRRNSVLLIPDEKQNLELSIEIRKKLQSIGDFGSSVILKQLTPRQRSKLNVGNYIQPLRNYSKRNLYRDDLYLVRGIRRKNLELEAQDKTIITTKSDFQFKAFQPRSFEVAEFEPLMWTDPYHPKSEFAIASVEEDTAFIQYSDGDLTTIEISKPLPIQSAIIQAELPKRHVLSVYALGDQSFDLQTVLEQTKNLKVFTQDVKLIVEATKTYKAQRDPIFAQQWAIEQDLRQEQQLGSLGNPSSISAFREQYRQSAVQRRAENRRSTVQNGIVFNELSRTVGRTTQWRRFKRHAGLTRAITGTIDTIQPALKGIKQYRYAVDHLSSTIRQKTVRLSASQLAKSSRNRGIKKKLVPVIKDVSTTLAQANESLKAKTKAIQAMQVSIAKLSNRMNKAEAAGLAQELIALLPKFRYTTRGKDGSLFIETETLCVNVSTSEVSVTRQGDHGELLRVRNGKAIAYKMSDRDLKLCRLLVKVIRNDSEIKRDSKGIRV